MEKTNPKWLAGDGEMAQRIRIHDWERTAVGAIGNWPATLRTALTMVLAHPLPMVLAWGPELTVLYNDAYRPLLGKKAEALGRPFLEVWREAKDVLAPQVASTLAGESHRFQNVPFTLLRGDQPEQTYFNYCLSPIRDDTGTVLGILNTGFEVTESFTARQQRSCVEEALRESEARFRALVTAGTYSIYRMSPDWRVMYQLDSETLANTADPIDNWVEKYIPEEDLPAVLSAIKQAIHTKSLFDLEHRVRLADESIGWVHSRAVPLLGRDGEITEWFGAGSNVTDRRRTAEELRAQEERYRNELEQQVRDQTSELKASRDLLQATMDSSVDMIQVFEAVRDSSGQIIDFRWLLNNHASESKYGDVIGKSLLQRNPGVVKEGIFDTFKRVVETGGAEQAEHHYVHEEFDGWFYQSVAKLGDGVATTTKDVSDWKATQAEVLRLQQEVAQASLRESEGRHALLLRLSDALRTISDPAEMQQAAMQLLGEHLGLSRAYYFDVERDGDTWIHVVDSAYQREADRPTMIGRHALAHFGEWMFKGFARGEVVAVADVDALPTLAAAELASYQALGVTAFIKVPLLRNGEYSAGIGAHDTRPHPWTQAEIDLIREVAERTWTAVERVRAEAALRQSEERLALAFKTLPVGIAIIDVDGELLMSNERMQRFLPTGSIPCRDTERMDRWKARDEAGQAVQPSDFPGARALRGETVSPGLQMIYRDDNDAEIWTEVLSAPLRDTDGRICGALSVVTDVDRIKRSEEAARASDERFRLFVEHVQEYALMQTNPGGEITSWNPGAERMFGYRSDEIVGKTFNTVLTANDVEQKVFVTELDFVAGGKRSEDARWMVRKDGSCFWARWITEPVYETDGRFRGLAKVMRDETERRTADEAIRNSLAEKEELLKEVHHRVKNNLQVIVSLLNMQARQIEDKDVLAHFQEARNRVLAISSIHELLYRAESFAGIALTEYARQLVPGLIRFYGLEARVQVELRGDGNKLELERAVPFGMLLNELVSNACKHAFPAPRSGNLLISIEPLNADIELTVADDGEGLPAGFDYQEASSLGLKLVNALARQLRGTVSVFSAVGTTVKVRFPETVTERDDER